jgi:PRTRC genetic system ThiF family protein
MSKRRREKHRLSQLARQHATQQQQPPAPQAPALNLDFMKASTVVTRDFDTVQIIIAGCGGIGAYVAQYVGRLLYVLYNNGKGANLTLVDPDVVKEENLGRQLFCNAEIGVPKAVALARRYGHAWGLNTTAFVGEYSESLIIRDSGLIVLVGCVDNAAARADLHHTLGHNPQEAHVETAPSIWWLDCGNLKDTGRVMLGSAHEVEQLEGSFIEKKKCLTLPSPALQYPSLLIPAPEEVPNREMSCAEMQAANLQSLNINAAIAVQASDFLTRLLITNDLKRYQCAVNVASGSVKSFYCTPEEIAREIGESVDFVKADSASEVAA